MAEEGDGVLIWGAKDYNYTPSPGVKLYRCEDAFIRGQGLGAELKRPQSLILDREGIYFDCSHPSDLENAINNMELTSEQILHGKRLRERLVKQRVSKYNLAGRSQDLFADALPGQKKILVTGQVDSDASIRHGSPEITSNHGLLVQVKKSDPDAFIVYKPHPDVVIAGREGHIPEGEVLKWADRIAVDSDIFDCIAQSDELHVMTSLAGFEALLQNKTVHVWGCPFYAGWSLTVDHYQCERRKVHRTIDELVYFAYNHYSRYIHWGTKRFTTPERVMDSLMNAPAQEQSSNRLVRWFFRQKRKAGYLIEAFLH